MSSVVREAFHAGEQAAQRRAGSRERMALIGTKVLRDAMPDQHREFFEMLPFVLLGALDAQGQPWATLLAGPTGFMTTPNATELRIGALPSVADPLSGRLREGASIGLLGIEPHTRRRNRMNGRVQRADAAGFEVAVSQSFGNCPKYIQPRELQWQGAQAEAPPIRSDHLDATMRALVQSADTFFIASTHPGAVSATPEAQEPRHGVDVSHRGGLAGFVHVDADDRLSVPDYLGNFFFNTLGNLLLEPRAGLLFVDWERGDLLHLAVRAEVVWDGPELSRFPGAQRVLRLQLTDALLRPGALPLHVVEEA